MKKLFLLGKIFSLYPRGLVFETKSDAEPAATPTATGDEGKEKPAGKPEEAKEKEKKKAEVKQESAKERTLLDSEVQQKDLLKKVGLDFRMDELMEKGMDFLREKFKGKSNTLLAIVFVIMDHVMEYQRPDENGGIQTREDLIQFAGTLDGAGKDGEANLLMLEKQKFMSHKKNTVADFQAAVEYRKQVDGVEQKLYGKNMEFDLRWNGEKIVVRHNSEGKEPEVTLDEYIEVMKANPGWDGKMEMDVKDRQTIPQLASYIEKMPENFRKGLMIGTFDPEVVMQVHNTLNEGKDEDKRIPIILHCFPLMRYSNPEDAKKLVEIFNDKKGKLHDLAKSTIKDIANDPQASINSARLYTSYEDFKNTDTPNADHILCLTNPIEELLQKDRKVVDAILYSGGEFSFPYDPKYMQWIKENQHKTGVGFKNIGVGFWQTTPDNIYDAMQWQDSDGSRVSRISVDI